MYLQGNEEIEIFLIFHQENIKTNGSLFIIPFSLKKAARMRGWIKYISHQKRIKLHSKYYKSFKKSNSLLSQRRIRYGANDESSPFQKSTTRIYKSKGLLKDMSAENEGLNYFKEIKRIHNLKEEINALEREFRENEVDKFKKLIGVKKHRKCWKFSNAIKL